MKKIETSKVFLLLMTLACCFVTSIYLWTMCGTERDMSDFTTLVCSMWAAWATYGGFYQWKSKCENRAKYAQKFIDSLADKYGIDAIAPIAQSVIQD